MTSTSQAAHDGRLFSLFAEAYAHRARANVDGRGAGDLDRAKKLDARIMATRAVTPAGIARKVQEVLEVMDSQEDEPDCWYRKMLRSVLADLTSMEPTSRPTGGAA